MKPVDAGVPPKFTLREDRQAGTTESWRTWAENREVEEWMQSVAGVLPQGWNDNAANQQGPRHYEFPTGYNNYFTGVERYAVGEQFCMHSAQLVVGVSLVWESMRFVAAKLEFLCTRRRIRTCPRRFPH